MIDSVANSGNTGTETKTYFAAYAGSECGGAWNNPIGLVPLSNGTHVIEYMGTGYGSTRFALITEQANATWKLKSFKIEEKRFTPKTSCGQHIPIDKDYNSNTTPLFTASTASTAVSVPATPTPKRVVITGSIAAGAAPAQFGASLSFSTTVGKVYTIYLENVSLETTNLAPSYQNYTGYAVVNNPADAGDAGKMLANGSLGYTNCYKGYAITFVARATTTWLVLGGMVAAQDAGQAASVSVLLQKLRIVGSQPIRHTVQLLADKRYRYGFNGQEKEPELGPGITGAPYWMYDARTAHRWNVDPVTYPWHGGYTVFNGNPILYADPLGLYGTLRENKMQAKKFAKWSGGKMEKIRKGHYSVNMEGTSMYENKLVDAMRQSIATGESTIISPSKEFFADGYTPDDIKANEPGWYKRFSNGQQQVKNDWKYVAETSTDAAGKYSPYNPNALETAEILDNVSDRTHEAAIVSASTGVGVPLAGFLEGVSKSASSVSLSLKVGDDISKGAYDKVGIRLGHRLGLGGAFGTLVEKSFPDSKMKKMATGYIFDKLLEKSEERTLEINSKKEE